MTAQEAWAAVQDRPVLVLLAVLAVLGVVAVWRTGRGGTRQAGRVVSLAGRMLATAVVITAGQWLVFTYVAGVSARLAALGLPALFAAYALTRAVTVTSHTTHRGGRR
ncbi:MAG TPA: hypothetical protein VLJ59_08020 [Mycobacteriales bacterium]|nr:hypothetical protein [Mycobacteriales bacterium]